VSGTAEAARGSGGATSLTAQEALAAVLALIAGYVDAYTFLNYQVYGSFMSGNTTQTGLQPGRGDSPSPDTISCRFRFSWPASSPAP
jgi:uncharacterized protein DUF1275